MILPLLLAAGSALDSRTHLPRAPKAWRTDALRHRPLTVRPAIKVGKLIRICPGKRHAWFQSSVGVIRKPLNSHIKL